MSDDKKTFRFQMSGRSAHATSVGAEHVGLAMSTEGIAVSLMMTTAEAGSMAAALLRAIDVSVGGDRPADAFDAGAEAERVLVGCGLGAPRLPAEDR